MPLTLLQVLRPIIHVMKVHSSRRKQYPCLASACSVSSLKLHQSQPHNLCEKMKRQLRLSLYEEEQSDLLKTSAVFWLPSLSTPFFHHRTCRLC